MNETDNEVKEIVKRVVNIAKNHDEAREWDIHQAVSMTPGERQTAAKELKLRVFGSNSVDVKRGARMKHQDET